MMHKWYEKIHFGLDWLNASTIVSVWELDISVEQQPTFSETIVFSWPKISDDFPKTFEHYRTYPKIFDDLWVLPKLFKGENASVFRYSQDTTSS